MSDFGSTLRGIIKTCGVKSYILADALGYDPSYLSKWLNNAKRPSAAMIDATASEIAAICIRSADAAAISKLAEEYRLPATDFSDKGTCTQMIKGIITRSFLRPNKKLFREKRTPRWENVRLILTLFLNSSWSIYATKWAILT